MEPTNNNPLSNAPGQNDGQKNSHATADSGKVLAILAYVIFFIPLLVPGCGPLARYHANQSLILLLWSIVLQAGLGILGHVTGVEVFNLLGSIVSLVVFVLWVIGIVNAAKGEMKELPIIGHSFTVIK